uniref:ribosomal protein L23 n=1 Tax=Christella acuminata TaxID=2137817 RepID=UPI0022FD6CCC|nr:ribosomal protein L23 [Christella acuminata]YP_010627474.1 ribosomal protein L23 [Christella parasitica]YP_010627543.1 ribosomal protein L23 [Cyclosorus aridus]WBK27223.1 ribosomal protein L23 [Christella acuminata]WBK27361.1 ribosomal protein L23 [Christella parasitica]WBK27430.1 ribosomal protein L23 [Cyclosorus aridus]
MKNQLITEKSIRLLQRNQYTFFVDSKLTKTEMKSWIEKFFDVKVEGINSSRVTKKRKGSKLSLNSASRKKMIARLRANYFIPLFIN